MNSSPAKPGFMGTWLVLSNMLPCFSPYHIYLDQFPIIVAFFFLWGGGAQGADTTNPCGSKHRLRSYITF